MSKHLPTSFLPAIDLKSLRRIVMAILIGAVGGAVFAYAELPLPWMLGAMTATMGASLSGAAITLPQPVRKPMIAIVGVALGSAFTPDRLEGFTSWLPSLLVLPIYAALIGGLVLIYLQRFSSFDGKTAFFAAMPGGLSEMILLADQLGGDMRNVALFHAGRLVLIVFSIPIIANILLDLEPVAAIDDPATPILLTDLAVLGALLVAGWLIAIPLRLPSPSFMGPLFLSSAVHLTGLTEAQPPFIAVAAAQLVIGTSVGCRFSGVPLKLIVKTLTIGAGGALLMFTVTLAFALGLYAITGQPLVLLLLALIPGGFPEMSLIALAMGFDPAFVVTHHGLRVFLVVTLALPAFKALSHFGWFERHWPTGQTSQPSSTDSGRRARK